MFGRKPKKHERSPGHVKREQEWVAKWLAQQAARDAAQKATEAAQASSLSSDQIKKEEIERMKEIAHTAFMTHPAASEEDFERCWPGLRDEMFKQHAIKVLSKTQAPDESLTDIEAAFRLFLSENDAAE
jgi:hypothetical protein